MPKAYTQYQLVKTYEEIALERKHVCSGCGGDARLSHSHLLPKSRRPDLATNKDNITYHCLGDSNGQGCHSKYESVECATLKDFESNFRMIFVLDREYFWLRIFKLIDYWGRMPGNWNNSDNILDRVRDLVKEFEKVSA